MGLALFEPETHNISFKNSKGDYSFDVRGLTLVDLSYLVSEHLADIEAAWVLWTSARAKISRAGSLDPLLLMLCRDAPLLVAEVISVAADDKENVENYSKIPFSVSAIALEQVLRLTTAEQGGLKNLLTSLQNLISEALPGLSARGVAAASAEQPLSASTGE